MEAGGSLMYMDFDICFVGVVRAAVCRVFDVDVVHSVHSKLTAILRSNKLPLRGIAIRHNDLGCFATLMASGGEYTEQWILYHVHTKGRNYFLLCWKTC